MFWKGLMGRWVVFRGRIIPFFLLVFFLFFYSFSQSPGVIGGDSGNLVAAAVLREVPHPPGYPLYTFLGWFLTKLPFGPMSAYRVGFLSSVPSAFSILVAFLIAKKIGKNTLIAFISSLALAFNYLFWLQAEIQEVFALHLLFLFLTLYLVLLWLEDPQAKIVYWLALIAGIEFSHHHTYALIFPALAYLFLANRSSKHRFDFFNRKSLVIVSLLFFVGVSFYLYVPLFSSSALLDDQGWLTNAKALIKLISRADYGTFKAAKNIDFSFSRGILSLIGFLNFLYHEFRLLGVILILLGFLRVGRERKDLFFFCLIWFLFTGPVFQIYAAFPVASWFSLGTVERFYLLPYPALFAWLVFGLQVIKEEIGLLASKSKFFSLKMQAILPYLVMLLFLLYPIFLVFENREKNNLRSFYEFEKLGIRLLGSCPRNSVFIVSGDTVVYLSHYQHYVNRVRPDLRLISLHNPRTAVFRVEDFFRFKPFFGNSSDPSENFWLEFKQYLSGNNLSVCSFDEEIKISAEYARFPMGLTYTHLKNLAEIDYEKVFEENRKIWNSYQLDKPAELDPRFEAFFGQELLRIYFSRAFSLSQFFFSAGEYEKARFWLNKAREYGPETSSLYRADFLIDTALGNCEEAKKKLEGQRPIFESSLTWPLLQEVYKEKCLTEKGI